MVGLLSVMGQNKKMRGLPGLCANPRFKQILDIVETKGLNQLVYWVDESRILQLNTQYRYFIEF